MMARIYLIFAGWLALGLCASFAMAHVGQPSAVWFWGDVLGLIDTSEPPRS